MGAAGSLNMKAGGKTGTDNTCPDLWLTHDRDPPAKTLVALLV
jgi:hypothetical protein